MMYWLEALMSYMVKMMEAWAAYWKTWAESSIVPPPPDEKRLPSLQEIREEVQKNVLRQEEIRCKLDKNIKHSKSLDEDINAVIADMIRRRNETDDQK